MPPTDAPGPVALVGSGEYLEAMADLERRLLDGRPPRYVQIPTAAAPEGEQVLARWLRLGADQADRLGVEQVAIVARDRHDADDPELAQQVEGAGLIYFSGGNPGYLASSLRDTALWRAVVEAWRRGAALAGCSAGAMALTSWAPSSRAWGSGPDPGLGLFDQWRVIPHFDRFGAWMPSPILRRVSRVPDGVHTVGIDEQTALVTGLDADGEWRVYGHRQVWLVDERGRRTGHAVGASVPEPPSIG
jgi:cyanophycinase-like exopeptidase